jgi:uncharacterized damage-inducible protein DinB
MFGCLAVVALVALSVPRAALSDDAVPGVRGAIIGNMMSAAKEVQELAAAVPDKKYDWRPGKGVRSVGEVYLHICQANYLLPMIMGATPPMSKEELMGMDKMTADKAKIGQMLKDSYAFATKSIADTPDTDLDTQVDFFGTKMSKLSLMMVLSSHSHEHLGQSIAYARTNGIVPPWTARQQAEAEKKADDKKKGGGM